jgi:hypothetical protein
LRAPWLGQDDALLEAKRGDNLACVARTGAEAPTADDPQNLASRPAGIGRPIQIVELMVKHDAAVKGSLRRPVAALDGCLLVGRSRRPDGPRPPGIDPPVEFVGIEPDEVTDPDEGHCPLSDKPSDLTHGDTQRVGDGLNVDQCRKRPVLL